MLTVIKWGHVTKTTSIVKSTVVTVFLRNIHADEIPRNSAKGSPLFRGRHRKIYIFCKASTLHLIQSYTEFSYTQMGEMQFLCNYVTDTGQYTHILKSL